MGNEEKLHAEMVENEIDEKIRERHEQYAPLFNKVEFDTNGLTEKCPKTGFATYDECRKCPFYLGHYGFIVYCDNRSTGFRGIPTLRIEKAIIAIYSGDCNRVDIETDIWNVTVYVVDKIIRIDLKKK